MNDPKQYRWLTNLCTKQTKNNGIGYSLTQDDNQQLINGWRRQGLTVHVGPPKRSSTSKYNVKQMQGFGLQGYYLKLE